METNKLNCIILDDEHLVRELLKRSIDWDSLGMKIAAEASTGMEALDLVEEIHPDIVFVDICMPIMNGIEFSKLVLEKYPQIKIIILTGHDDFKYARESVKLGVADFILKPINAVEIDEVLQNVCAQVRTEKSYATEHTRLKKQIEDNLPFLKEKFFCDLLLGVLSEEEISSKLEYYGTSFSSSTFQIAVVETSFPSIADAGEEDLLMLKMQCFDILKQYFCKENGVIPFYGIHRNIVLLNNNPVLCHSDYYETIKNNLLNSSNCSISIGVGSKKDSIALISQSYNEANMALQYKIIEGRNNVINYAEVNSTEKKKDTIVLSDSLPDFTFYLRAGIYDESTAVMNTIFDEQHFSSDTGATAIQVYAANIISVILNVITEFEIARDMVFNSGKQPYECVFKIVTLPEMKKYLCNLIEAVTKSINEINSKHTGKLISDVKHFLQKNFSKHDLAQNVVAEEFFVNSSYLSRKFKQETGQSFVEYLSRLRLEKAITLLQETDKKNYEISDEVGIADPHYFSIFFKKYMNMSISDYRREIKSTVSKPP